MPAQGRVCVTSSQRMTPRPKTSHLGDMPPSLELKHSGALRGRECARQADACQKGSQHMPTRQACSSESMLTHM